MALTGLSIFMEDLARSEDISNEKLNEWIHRYDYCQSLHLLKAKKEFDKLGKIPESEAVYAIDRTHFIQQVKSGESYVKKIPDESSLKFNQVSKADLDETDHRLNEPGPDLFETPAESIEIQAGTEAKIDHVDTEVIFPALESTTESTVDKELEFMASKEQTPQKEFAFIEDSTESSNKLSNYDKDETTESNESIEPAKISDTPEDMIFEFEEPSPSLTQEAEYIPEPKKIKKPDLPGKIADAQQAAETLPLSPFAQWLITKNQEGNIPNSPAQDSIQEPPEVNPATKEALKKSSIEIQNVIDEEPEIAPDVKTQIRKSIEESNVIKESIASETLAKLLLEQGHSDLAIQMYEKLILSNPEKSGFFAVQIEKIRNP